MKVSVLFFAQLRDQVGVDQLELSLANGGAEGLWRALRESISDQEAYAALTAPSVRIAVNQVLIEGDYELNHGDEVAFLPPVTGG